MEELTYDKVTWLCHFIPAEDLTLNIMGEIQQTVKTYLSLTTWVTGSLMELSVEMKEVGKRDGLEDQAELQSVPS